MSRQPITQYHVEYPDQPGIHAKLVRALVKDKVDFKSVVTTRVGDVATIQFLAPRNDALRDKLAKMGVEVKEDLVFQLEMPHHHWELHKLAKSLAEKDINILSLYSMVEGDNMRIVLAVDQPANAMALVQKLGFNPDYSIYE